MATRLHARYGENNLIEPNTKIVSKLWKEVGDHLHRLIQPGIYRDRETINKTMQAAYKFVEERLERQLQRLASREFMEFVLYQYDLATELWHLAPESGSLSDLHHESHLASRRRALKHLAEQITQRLPPEFAPIHASILAVETEEALLCADILVTLYMMSDRTHFLFPDHSQLTLFKKYQLVPIRLDPVHPFESADIDLNRRFATDRAYRVKCFPDQTIDSDPSFQGEILDDYFSAAFGVTYRQHLVWLNHILREVKAAPGSYPVVFYPRDRLADEMASCGIELDAAKRILAGFTLRSADMKIEARQLWNPKQTYRAYRRGFFEFPHLGGPHLTWSTRMASESLNWLITGACFKKLPVEWATPAITLGLQRLSKATSDWFEQQTIECLLKLGIEGSRRKRRLIGHDESIDIPPEVGEIDFLGYAVGYDLLVIAECKMVESRMEPRFWKEDVGEFLEDRKSYAKKFLRKIQWARQNCASLTKILIGDSKARQLASVMLTFSPSFAAIHIEEFPCVSLAEFTADVQSSKQWPYEIGLSPDSLAF